MPDIIFIALLGFLIIFSCLSFGSVTILPLTVVETVIAFMVLFWLLEMAYKRQLSFIKTGFNLPVFLFLGFVAVQLIPLPLVLVKYLSYYTGYLFDTFIPSAVRPAFHSLSIYPNATFAEFLKYLSFTGLFFMVMHKIEKKWQVDALINLIIIFGLAISLAGLSVKLIAPETGGFIPFINRNNFAGFINMIIPLALGYFLTDMPFSKRLIYAFTVAIMSLALFLSLSRGGALVYIFVLFFLLVLSGLKGSLRRRMNILAIWFFATIFVFVFFLKGKVVWDRLSTLFTGETLIAFGHGYSWLDVSRMCHDFPFIGAGLGTFGAISQMYKTVSDQSLYTYTHNDYFQFLSEVGLIGCGLLASFFFLYFRNTMKLWLERHDSYFICLILGGLCSILGMLVYSFLDFNLQIPANMLLFAIILGLVYRLSFLRVKNAISD